MAAVRKALQAHGLLRYFGTSVFRATLLSALLFGLILSSTTAISVPTDQHSQADSASEQVDPVLKDDGNDQGPPQAEPDEDLAELVPTPTPASSESGESSTQEPSSPAESGTKQRAAETKGEPTKESRASDGGGFGILSAQNPRCTDGYVYAVNADGFIQEITPTGAGAISAGYSPMRQYGFNPRLMGTVNALGMRSDGFFYAIERPSTTTSRVRIMGYLNGAYGWVADTYINNGVGVARNTIAGAVDPTVDKYLFGYFTSTSAGATFHLYELTEGTTMYNGRVRELGTVRGLPPQNNSTLNNGDMAFDANGNLYIVRHNTISSSSGTGTLSIISVPSSSID